VPDLSRELGNSNTTFYNLKANNGGMEVNFVKGMKSLEEENSRLKKMYAELSLLYHALSIDLQLIFNKLRASRIEKDH
jgi:putative transposase